MTRPFRRLAASLLCLPLCLPAQADDAARIVGGILGAIVNEQSRQQQQRDLQRQQQYQQQQYQQQQQRRQQNAQRQAAPQPKQPQMSLAERKAVQRALREAGFYAGAIDGALGPGSRKAIAAWQDSVGAAASGYLAPRQARTLVAQAPAPKPEPDPEPEPEPEFAQDFAEPGMAATQPPAALFPESQTDSGALFAEAADTAPDSAPSGAPLLNEDQLYAAYLFWALSRAPDQIWDPRLASAYGQLPMADGQPPRPGLQPAELRPLVEDAVRHYGQNPPRRAVLDLPLSRQKNDTDASGLAQRATHWNPDLAFRLTDISGVKAITEWQIRHGAGRTLLLAPEKPFFLPLPADYRSAWAQPATDSSQPLLRVEIALDELRPSADLSGYPMGRARMTVQRASLVLVSARQGAAPAERVLHSWTGEAPAARSLDRPASAAELAAIYGVTESAGRVLTTPQPQTRRNRAKPDDRPPALLAREGGYVMGGDVLQLLDQAIRLAALIEAGPDRPMDPQLTQDSASTLLSRRERVELLPTALAVDNYGGAGSGMSELSVRKALTQAEPRMRRLIAGRAPQMPVPLRAVLPMQLGEYDFDAGGFPLGMQRSAAMWLPDLFSDQNPLVPKFFRIDMDNAEKLLAHLDQSGSAGNRTVHLVADYALAAMRTRPAADGPITHAELETVEPQVYLEALALFADPAARTRIRDLAVPAAMAAPPADAPQDGATPGALPDEIYATSGKSLMAAVAVRHPGALQAGLLDPQDIAGLPEDRRGGRAQDYRAELPGLARDSYWIAAVMQIDDYDAGLGGFPTRQVRLDPVPYARDLSGALPPTVVAASRADYELLRVPPEQAGAVAALRDDNGALHMVLNVPVADATAPEGEHPTLSIGPPTEAILGRSSHASWPDAAELRVTLAAPDRLAWVLADPDQPTGAPETLLLDPEGLDLLALSMQPDLYDDAGYRRMLLGRRARESVAAKGTPMRLDWDRFFRDPDKRMEPAEIDAMLPAFRAWTAARVALLPQQLLLPVTRGGAHPLTGCAGATELGLVGDDDRAALFRANAPALLGGPMPALEQVLVLHGTRPRPGPDRLWTLGDPPRGPSSACQFLRGEGRGESGSYADLLLQVEAQPQLARLDETALSAASYALTLSDRRLVAAEALTDAPEHLRGVLVLKTAVQAVDLFSNDPKTGAPAAAGRLGPDDWQPVTGTPPVAQDVLGMTLGMSLAEFDKAARAHLPQADHYRTTRPGTPPFGSAEGYLDPATGEALAAVYAPASPDRTVVAIMRQLEFPKAEISVEGLRASLVEKYGPAITEYRDLQWTWGTLPADEDGYGFCGGQSTLNPMSAEGQPEMGSDDPAALERARSSQRGDPGFWMRLGWPSVALAGQGPAPDLARCGPVVAVAVEPHHKPDTVILRLWLSNRKLAEDLAAAAAPAEPARPKVRF